MKLAALFLQTHGRRSNAPKVKRKKRKAASKKPSIPTQSKSRRKNYFCSPTEESLSTNGAPVSRSSSVA